MRSCPLSCAGSPRATSRCGSGLGSARGRRMREGKSPRRHTIAAATLRTSQGNLSQRVLLVGCAKSSVNLAHCYRKCPRPPRGSEASAISVAPGAHLARGPGGRARLTVNISQHSVNTQSTSSQHTVNIQAKLIDLYYPGTSQAFKNILFL